MSTWCSTCARKATGMGWNAIHLEPGARYRIDHDPETIITGPPWRRWRARIGRMAYDLRRWWQRRQWNR